MLQILTDGTVLVVIDESQDLGTGIGIAVVAAARRGEIESGSRK